MTRLLPILLLAACSSDTDLEASFCDILSASDATVTATDDPSTAPTVTLEDASATIELQGESPLFTGFVAYDVDEDGSFAFGLSHDAEFWLTDADGTRMSPISEVTGSDCDSLAARSTWDLTIGTWYLEFEAGVSAVTVTAEESDDDL